MLYLRNKSNNQIIKSVGMVEDFTSSGASLVASKPSSWGIFVYNAETGMETKMALHGKGPSALTFSFWHNKSGIPDDKLGIC